RSFSTPDRSQFNKKEEKGDENLMSQCEALLDLLEKKMRLVLTPPHVRVVKKTLSNLTGGLIETSSTGDIVICIADRHLYQLKNKINKLQSLKRNIYPVFAPSIKKIIANILMQIITTIAHELFHEREGRFRPEIFTASISATAQKGKQNHIYNSDIGERRATAFSLRMLRELKTIIEEDSQFKESAVGMILNVHISSYYKEQLSYLEARNPRKKST
ncbi:hypothetical protein KC686_03515, partial [Candidatus Woesebacteria bacterium]|nr:hypothetical protein [Candidatus Woesebacteria bacterium]